MFRPNLHIVFASAALITGVVTVVVVVLTLLSAQSGDFDGFLTNYALRSAERVAFHVETHFAHLRTNARNLIRDCNARDLLPNVSDPSMIVRMYSDLASNSEAEFAVALHQGISFGVTKVASIGRDRVTFPPVPGLIVVETTNSLLRQNSIGYYNVTDGAPYGSPRIVFNSSYNVSALPFAISLMSEDLVWTSPAAVYGTLTSTIAIGGHFSVVSNMRQESSWGYCALFDYSSALSGFLATLVVSHHEGAVVLVDVATRSFLGGNIADLSVRSDTSNPIGLRLVTWDELKDVTIVDVVAASRRSGDLVMRCASPCSLMIWDGVMTQRAPLLWAVYRSFTVVRVESVTDAYGLNVRVVVALTATSSFLGKTREAANQSMFISGAVLIALVACAVVAADRLVLRHLRAFEELMIQLSSASIEKRKSVAGALLGQVSRVHDKKLRQRFRGDSFVRDVEKLQAAIATLIDELDVIESYVPAGGCRFSVSPSPKSDERSSETQDDAFDSIHGGSTVLPPMSPLTGDRGLTSFHPRLVTSVVGIMTVPSEPKRMDDTASVWNAFVATAAHCAADHGGECYFFVGGSVQLHFNASRPLKRHAECAVEAVLAMKQQLSASNNIHITQCRFAFGIASGVALCGTTLAPRFGWSSAHVIGPCSAQATDLAEAAMGLSSAHFVSNQTSRLLPECRWRPRLVVQTRLHYEKNRSFVSKAIRVDHLPSSVVTMLETINCDMELRSRGIDSHRVEHAWMQLTDEERTVALRLCSIDDFEK